MHPYNNQSAGIRIWIARHEYVQGQCTSFSKREHNLLVPFFFYLSTIIWCVNEYWGKDNWSKFINAKHIFKRLNFNVFFIWSYPPEMVLMNLNLAKNTSSHDWVCHPSATNKHSMSFWSMVMFNFHEPFVKLRTSFLGFFLMIISGCIIPMPFVKDQLYYFFFVLRLLSNSGTCTFILLGVFWLFLKDPAGKRRIVCSKKLKEIFEVDSFNGFTASKLLSSHFIKTEKWVAYMYLTWAH